MRKMLVSAILGSLMALAPMTANAASVIKTLTLNATFADAPSVSVTFGLNFNNASSLNNNTSAVTQVVSNTFGPLAIGYDAPSDILSIIGGNGTAGPGGCGNGPGSFCSFINNVSSSNPTSTFFLLFDAAAQTHFANAVTVSDAAAVPEPATWALMMAGFAALGFGLRRRTADQARVAFA